MPRSEHSSRRLSASDLAAFEAILLDMNGTFMFGHDRLGAEEDFHATYRRLGGTALGRDVVQAAIAACCGELDRKYRDPAWQDRFPTVPAVLDALPDTAALPAPERRLLAEVIAGHELGDVAPPFVEALTLLSASHPLGVVSNLWSQKQPWLDHLEDRDLLGRFAVLVFSSDGPHIKPSPQIFRPALDALAVASDRILFVGDDPRCDVQGAAALGMRTLLVGEKQAPGIEPDWHLPSLLDLPPRT